MEQNQQYRTHRISNPSSKLWWYKAFISNSSLLRHCVPRVCWKLCLGCYVAVKHYLFCFLFSVVLSKSNVKGISVLHCAVFLRIVSMSIQFTGFSYIIAFSTLYFRFILHDVRSDNMSSYLHFLSLQAGLWHFDETASPKDTQLD